MFAQRSTLIVLAATTLAAVAGCAHNAPARQFNRPLPSPPAASTNQLPNEPAPVAIGQSWNDPAGQWRLTLTTDWKCGRAADVRAESSPGAQDVCRFPVSGVNIGASAARLVSFGPVPAGDLSSPLDLPVAGYDDKVTTAQSRVYTGMVFVSDQTNPGLTDTTRIEFDVPTGVTIRHILIGSQIVEVSK